jgi:WD40 repeat protein
LEISLPISFPPLRDEELGDVRRVVDADMVIPPRQRSRPNREPNYDLGVHSVDWSPQDPTALLSAGGDGSVRLWDIRMTANCVASFNVDARHAGGSAGAEPRDADELRGGVGAL